MFWKPLRRWLWCSEEALWAMAARLGGAHADMCASSTAEAGCMHGPCHHFMRLNILCTLSLFSMRMLRKVNTTVVYTVKSRFIEVDGDRATNFGQVRLRYIEAALYGQHNACTRVLYLDQLQPLIN